jgi:hypothetical protein
MYIFLQATLLITGLWLTFSALATNTKNLASSMFYKVIPFLLGLSCIISFLFVVGVLKG